METDNTREKAVFDAAMAFDNTAARDDYVLKACGDNQQLLAGVRALLRYHDASSFLEPPGSEDELSLDARPFSESPGTIID